MSAIQRLRKLEKAATKGPWETYDNPIAATVVTEWRNNNGKRMKIAVVPMMADRQQADADAALIAESRNLLPLLLDVVEAAERMWGVGYGHPVDSDAVVMGNLSRALSALTENEHQP